MTWRRGVYLIAAEFVNSNTSAKVNKKTATQLRAGSLIHLYMTSRTRSRAHTEFAQT